MDGRNFTLLNSSQINLFNLNTSMDYSSVNLFIIYFVILPMFEHHHQMKNPPHIVFIEDSENDEVEDNMIANGIEDRCNGDSIMNGNTIMNGDSIMNGDTIIPSTNKIIPGKEKTINDEKIIKIESSNTSDEQESTDDSQYWQDEDMDEYYSESDYDSDSEYDDSDDDYSSEDDSEDDYSDSEDDEFNSSGYESESIERRPGFTVLYTPNADGLYSDSDSTDDDNSAYSDSYYNSQSHHNELYTSFSDNAIDLSNVDSIDALNDDFDGRRISRQGHSNDVNLPTVTERFMDTDVVILESTNMNEVFPRVSKYLVSLIVQRLINVYFGVKASPLLASRIENFSEDEMKFLRTRVKTSLMGILEDHRIIKRLMELVSKEKIDEEVDIYKKRKIGSTYFRDMVNIESKSCGICYGDFKGNQKCSTLRCHHIFHSKCIKKWIKDSWCCPMCRSENIQ